MNRIGKRQAGILLPAFSLRREGDLGIGDTLALRAWVNWAADHGISFIQLLPINEQGAEESPYSAISSAALDPIYLTISPDEIPGLDDADIARARGRASHAIHAPAVDYPLVRQIKRELLELAWANFSEETGALTGEFEKFCKAEASWLEDYCLFRFLMVLFGESLSWDKWPANCQTPVLARAFIAKQRKLDPESLDYRIRFFAFVQWLCFKQWRGLRAYADERNVKLMGDIPIGVNWHSADVFFNREDFHLDWCGGSPAEGSGDNHPFLHQWGQNWGIPLYHWDLMKKNDFRWWRQRISRVTEIFRMFRIDHILGFYRIYAFPWKPERNHEFLGLSHEEAARHTGGKLPRWFMRPDDSEENQAENREEGAERLRGVLAETADAEIIAEDLGWVPGYVRPQLGELGIAGYRIPHWDCNENGHPIPGAGFPENSFACYSTHDHDPISAIWRNCVNAVKYYERHPTHESAWQAGGARNALRIISEFAEMPASGPYPDFTEGVRLRLIKALFSSKSRYVSLMVTELFGMSERINEPGTHAENWTFRLPWTLAQIEADGRLSEMCRTFKTLIQITGRAPERD